MNPISNVSHITIDITEEIESRGTTKPSPPDKSKVLDAIRGGHIGQLEAWQEQGFDFHDFTQQYKTEIEQSIMFGTGQIDVLEAFFAPFLRECVSLEVGDPFAELVNSKGMILMNDLLQKTHTQGKFEKPPENDEASGDERDEISIIQFSGKKIKRPTSSNVQIQMDESFPTCIHFDTEKGRMEWTIPEHHQRQLLKLKNMPRPPLGEIKCFVEKLQLEFEDAGQKITEKEFLNQLFPLVNYSSYKRTAPKMAQESILGEKDQDRLSKLLDTPKLALDKVKEFIKDIKNKLAKRDEKMSEKTLLRKFFPEVNYNFYKTKKSESDIISLLPAPLLERAAELRQKYNAKSHGLLPDVVKMVAEASRECKAMGQSVPENKLLSQLFPEVNGNSFRQIKKNNTDRVELTAQPVSDTVEIEHINAEQARNIVEQLTDHELELIKRYQAKLNAGTFGVKKEIAKFAKDIAVRFDVSAREFLRLFFPAFNTSSYDELQKR